MTQSLLQGLLAPEYLRWLWHGLVVTIELSVLTVILATLLGFLITALYESRWRPLRMIVIGYCALFRDTPLLVQLFFWYFGVTKLLPPDLVLWLNTPHALYLFGFMLHWPSFEFLAGLFGLTLYSAAFIAEEIRAGIRGIPTGQRHAAEALGFRPWQTMRYIILPQALNIAYPPLLGQYMNVVKNSSLTMAIGVAELSYASRQVETETLKTFQAFAIATVFYIAVIALIEGWGAFRQYRRAARSY